MKVLVVVMGVMIVAGVMTLGVVMTQRLSSPRVVLGNVMLDEPAGTQIVGATPAGDTLAVQLRGGGPDRVALLDIKTGKMMGRVGLAK